jgi:hypothetical protein
VFVFSYAGVDFSGRSKPFTFIYYPQRFVPTEERMDFYGFYMQAVPFYNFYHPDSFYTFYSFSSLEVGKASKPPAQLVRRR